MDKVTVVIEISWPRIEKTTSFQLGKSNDNNPMKINIYESILTCRTPLCRLLFCNFRKFCSRHLNDIPGCPRKARSRLQRINKRNGSRLSPFRRLKNEIYVRRFSVPSANVIRIYLHRSSYPCTKALLRNGAEGVVCGLCSQSVPKIVSLSSRVST